MAQADQRKGIRMTERRQGKNAACEAVCTALTTLRGQVEGQSGLLDLRLQQVEKGVSNYVNFQRVVEKFITESTTRDEERIRHDNLRAQEIKDALAKHYAELNLKIGHKTLMASFWQIAIAGAAIAVMIFFGIVSYKQLQHGEIIPLKLLHTQTEMPYNARVDTWHEAGNFSSTIGRR
jgi:hypothetical protein